jgi:hypothetical protein
VVAQTAEHHKQDKQVQCNDHTQGKLAQGLFIIDAEQPVFKLQYSISDHGCLSLYKNLFSLEYLLFIPGRLLPFFLQKNTNDMEKGPNKNPITKPLIPIWC